MKNNLKQEHTEHKSPNPQKFRHHSLLGFNFKMHFLAEIFLVRAASYLPKMDYQKLSLFLRLIVLTNLLLGWRMKILFLFSQHLSVVISSKSAKQENKKWYCWKKRHASQQKSNVSLKHWVIRIMGYFESLANAIQVIEQSSPSNNSICRAIYEQAQSSVGEYETIVSAAWRNLAVSLVLFLFFLFLLAFWKGEVQTPQKSPRKSEEKLCRIWLVGSDWRCSIWRRCYSISGKTHKWHKKVSLH